MENQIVWAPYWIRQSIKAHLMATMLEQGSEEFKWWIVPEVYWIHNRKEVYV